MIEPTVFKPSLAAGEWRVGNFGVNGPASDIKAGEV